MNIHILIQARMSSARFPGKVLAPLFNKPLIKHIIDRVKCVDNIKNIIVLTSEQSSDDPLVAYLQSIKCHFFRGPLDNVFSRFQAALKAFPCDYFIRLCADSPFMDSNLINFMLEKINSNNHNYDIISNVMTRSYPKGQSVEIIKSSVFLNTDVNLLTKDDCEHVFPYFYRNADQYKILAIKNNINESQLNFCVDTIEDLTRLSTTGYHYSFNKNVQDHYVE